MASNKGSGGIHMGRGLPPILAKLVARIEVGEFIDMAKLLPDKLGFLMGAFGEG